MYTKAIFLKSVQHTHYHLNANKHTAQAHVYAIFSVKSYKLCVCTLVHTQIKYLKKKRKKNINK